MDAPAARVAGLTAAGEGAVRRRRRRAASASSARRADRRRRRAADGRRAVLPRRARRAVGRRGRARGPAVPVARSRSVPRPGAALRRRLGPRARAARASRPATARLVVASAAALLPRVSAPGAAGAGVARRSSPARTSRRPISATCSSTPASRARIRSTSTASSACAAASSTSFPPARREPVRLEFIGDTIESLRTYDPATQRSTGALDQAAIVPLHELLGETGRRRIARRRSSTTSGPAAGRPCSSPSRTRSTRTATQAARADRSASYDEAARARAQRVPPPDDADRRLGRRSRAGSSGAPRSRRWRSTDDEPGDASTSRCQPAIEFAGRVPDWVAEIRRGRERGETMLFVAAHAGPRRAHDRAARRLRRLRRAGRARRGRARAPRCSSASAASRAASGCPTPALQLYAETDVFEEERRAPRAPPVGDARRSSPTSAT